MKKTFYSNCLFEAIKAKLKNWKNVSIHFIPGWLEPTGHFHFYWNNSSNNTYYDFRLLPGHHKNLCIFFKGYIEVSSQSEWEKRMYRSTELLNKKLQKKYNFNSTNEKNTEIDELNKKLAIYREESAFYKNFTDVSLLSSDKYLNDLERHNVNYVFPFKKTVVNGIPIMESNGKAISVKKLNQIPNDTTDFLVL